MEIKKGKITEVGTLEQTKNGNTMLHVTIQIGTTETYNRYTGEKETSREEVDYTFWHDDARNMESHISVGDVVQFEIDHYVDRQWKRTNVVTRNLKVLKAAETPQGSAPVTATPKQTSIPTPPAKEAEATDDLPF